MNMVAKKSKVLFTAPLHHISAEPFESLYDIQYLKSNSATTAQQQLIDQVNQFLPSAIYQNNQSLKYNNSDLFNHLSPNAKQQLKLIVNHGAGYDKINIDSCTEHKIYVSHLPDVVSDATADLTMCLMLNCARRTNWFQSSLQNGHWNRGTANSSTGMMFGFDLKNKVLGIVGLGSIGKQVVKRAQAFGMKVIYFKRNPLSQQEELDLGLITNNNNNNQQQVYYSNLNEMIAQSDIISIHTPLTPETHHFISHEQFNHMKPTSYLINTSRGPVVDEKALIEALKTKKIAGCGLDVYENEPKVSPELIEMLQESSSSSNGQYNIVLYPHIGTATKDTRINMEQLCMDNLEHVLVKQHEKPITTVPEQKHLDTQLFKKDQ